LAAQAPPAQETAAALRAACRRGLDSSLRGERETHMFCNSCNNNGLWIIILIIILFGWGGSGFGCGCGCDNNNGCGCGCGCN
jgi:hypothetical protein